MKKDLRDFIITIPNVLPPDEYYNLLDFCEETDQFQRVELFPPSSLDPNKVGKHGEDTFHQRGQRFSIKLKSGLYFNLVKKAFSFGLKQSLNQYDFLLPEIHRCVSGFWLLKYCKDDFLTMHSDFEAESGSLTMSYCINDDYNGGELVFWDEYVIPNQKNTIHVFPSCFLYPHEVKPVKSGIRYSAITWFGYIRGDLDFSLDQN